MQIFFDITPYDNGNDGKEGGSDDDNCHESNHIVTKNNSSNNHDNKCNLSPESGLPPAWLRLPPLTDGKLALYNTAFDLEAIIQANSAQIPTTYNTYNLSDTTINTYTIMCDRTEPILYKIFRIQKHAATFIGIGQSSSICVCCNGIAKESYGFRWKSVEGTYAQCEYLLLYIIIHLKPKPCSNTLHLFCKLLLHTRTYTANLYTPYI